MTCPQIIESPRWLRAGGRVDLEIFDFFNPKCDPKVRSGFRTNGSGQTSSWRRSLLHAPYGRAKTDSERRDGSRRGNHEKRIPRLGRQRNGATSLK